MSILWVHLLTIEIRVKTFFILKSVKWWGSTFFRFFCLGRERFLKKTKNTKKHTNIKKRVFLGLFVFSKKQKIRKDILKTCFFCFLFRSRTIFQKKTKKHKFALTLSLPGDLIHYTSNYWHFGTYYTANFDILELLWHFKRDKYHIN